MEQVSGKSLAVTSNSENIIKLIIKLITIANSLICVYKTFKRKMIRDVKFKCVSLAFLWLTADRIYLNH